MSAARKEILSRIRSALADVAPGESPADVQVVRDYRRHGELGAEQRAERLAERVRDYQAGVRRVTSADLPAAVDDACAQMGLRRVVIPEALAPSWRPAGVEVIEDRGLTAAQLDAIDGAVTGCAGAIAETGTLILDGQGASGRRLITLVPDHHICVVTVDQIVEQVPEAIAALAPAVRRHGVPVTLVSGPSASSDIELSRVEGVHGPRHLMVLIVAAERGAA